jgi:glyoxylase-like metal-dependent hydrolase (beta-lactamase superfamily II)
MKNRSARTTSGLLSRKHFLAGAGGAVMATICGDTSSCRAASTDQQSDKSQRHTWKGRPGSSVVRWDVITIGNLSRNRYWGEPDTKALRPAICTTTLISGKTFKLLVDPSLADAKQMAAELDRRTGLKPADVTAVFVTHEHGDHWAGINHFPGARWIASPGVADILNNNGKLAKKLEGFAAGRLFDGVDVIPTPGHTQHHHSVRFDCEGMSIVAAGDALATRDFFRERRGYFNAIDFALSARTMDMLAEVADVLIPGHDNYFLTSIP